RLYSRSSSLPIPPPPRSTLSPYTTLFRSPALLESGQLPALGPLLGIEHLGPEVEQPAAVAVVKPDRELARVGPGCLCGPYDGSLDRKSTRLNSSHVKISYAVFCLKKKKIN